MNKMLEEAERIKTVVPGTLEEARLIHKMKQDVFQRMANKGKGTLQEAFRKFDKNRDGIGRVTRDSIHLHCGDNRDVRSDHTQKRTFVHTLKHGLTSCGRRLVQSLVRPLASLALGLLLAAGLGPGPPSPLS